MDGLSCSSHLLYGEREQSCRSWRGTSQARWRNWAKLPEVCFKHMVGPLWWRSLPSNCAQCDVRTCIFSRAHRILCSAMMMHFLFLNRYGTSVAKKHGMVWGYEWGRAEHLCCSFRSGATEWAQCDFHPSLLAWVSLVSLMQVLMSSMLERASF